MYLGGARPFRVAGDLHDGAQTSTTLSEAAGIMDSSESFPTLKTLIAVNTSLSWSGSPGAGPRTQSLRNGVQVRNFGEGFGYTMYNRKTSSEELPYGPYGGAREDSGK